MSTAVDDADRLRERLAESGGTVRLLNGGAHWHIKVHGSLVQWWPESGRLVRDAKWGAVLKAHDVDQVAGYISQWHRRGKLKEGPRDGAPPRGRSRR